MTTAQQAAVEVRLSKAKAAAAAGATPLRAKRLSLGLSMATVSAAVQASEPSMCRWETGEHSPNAGATPTSWPGSTAARCTTCGRTRREVPQVKTTAKPLKVPPNGPTDPAVFLTMLAVHDCPEGAIDYDDGRTMWACDPVRRERFALDLGVIDDLTRRGWLDDSHGYDVLSVTERGRW
jgi:hypothetical protein